MYVLIYVTTLLMLLGSMSYVWLESFRSIDSFRSGILQAMQYTERAPINDLAEAMYNKIHIGTHQTDARNARIPASPRLSFRVFIDQEYRSQNPALFQQTRELAKKIMTQLYSQQPFFQRIKEQRPQFLDEILDELMRASDAIPKEIKLYDASCLSKIELPSKGLHTVFYYMLHGEQKGKPKTTSNDSPFGELVIDDALLDMVTTDDAILFMNEAKAPSGNASLLDFITIKRSPKVRVQLASRALLTAIFGKENIVDEVIEKRIQLAKDVQHGRSQQEASADFKATFEGAGESGAYKDILDFTVSKTNPKPYE